MKLIVYTQGNLGMEMLMCDCNKNADTTNPNFLHYNKEMRMLLILGTVIVIAMSSLAVCLMGMTAWKLINGGTDNDIIISLYGVLGNVVLTGVAILAPSPLQALAAGRNRTTDMIPGASMTTINAERIGTAVGNDSPSPRVDEAATQVEDKPLTHDDFEPTSPDERGKVDNHDPRFFDDNEDDEELKSIVANREPIRDDVDNGDSKGGSSQ